MSPAPTLRQLFQSTSLSQILHESPPFLISIKSTETFYQALRLMNRYHILSVCCMEEKTGQSTPLKRGENGQAKDAPTPPPTPPLLGSSNTNSTQNSSDSTILGFLSNLDILFYLSESLLLFDLEEFDTNGINLETTTEPTLRQCLNQPIKYLMHQKLETEHYHTMHESESVWSVVEGKFALGVHRIIVMREERHSATLPQKNGSHNQNSPDSNLNTSLVGMISQSDIIKFAVNSEWRDEPFNVSEFLETMWKDRDVIAVYEDDTLMEALKQMATHSLSAVAVVESRSKRQQDDDMMELDEYQHPYGRLVANFSASDLRRIIQGVSPTGEDNNGTSLPQQQHDYHTQTLPQYFNMKIRDYLNKFSKRSLSPITISSTNRSLTMRGIVGLFEKEKIHRVWIVDENQCPQGLLSLTDLCEFVALAPYNE